MRSAPARRNRRSAGASRHLHPTGDQVGAEILTGIAFPNLNHVFRCAAGDDVAAASATPDEAAIRRHLRDVLAAYKVPKRVLVADDLPRNTMGKVVKAELRDIHRTLYLGPSAEGAQ